MAPNVGSLKQQYHMWLGLSFRRSAMTWSRQLRKRRVTTCLPLNFNKHHRICSFWAPMLAMMIRGMGVEICVRAVLKRMCLSHRNISWIENNVLVWASKEPKHHVCMCVCESTQYTWVVYMYLSWTLIPLCNCREGHEIDRSLPSPALWEFVGWQTSTCPSTPGGIHHLKALAKTHQDQKKNRPRTLTINSMSIYIL